MIDLSRDFTVETEQNEETGKWSARCPSCNRLVLAMTDEGLTAALCAHLNEWHFIPRRGNA